MLDKELINKKIFEFLELREGKVQMKELKDFYATLRSISFEGLSSEERKKGKSIIHKYLEKGFQRSHTPNLSPYSNLLERIINKPLKKSQMLYSLTDVNHLQNLNPSSLHTPVSALQTLDDLLQRDKQREKDGFPKKVKIKKYIFPSGSGQGKVVVIPSTTEDKFYHDDRTKFPGQGGGGTGGTGEGEEGDVIGEDPLMGDEGEEGDEGEGGAEGGQGDGTNHDIESGAYDLGKILTEEFKLPNLKDKGKKRAVPQYKYDLTDRKRGSGQLLDYIETLKSIVQTNLILGNIEDPQNIDPSKLIISPDDKVYRLLSKEKLYESQAIVFLLRDYSGSMMGAPTEVIVTQHIFIYAWLTFQYQNLVESRFIVHDTEAKEVPDFYTYYKLQVAGGTDIHTSFKLVNQIVEEENLAKDYNIYVFYGGDGGDWKDGKETLGELEKMMGYVNRVGITISDSFSDKLEETEMGQYLINSEIIKKYPNLIKLDAFNAERATEERIMEGIKKLIS